MILFENIQSILSYLFYILLFYYLKKYIFKYDYRLYKSKNTKKYKITRDYKRGTGEKIECINPYTDEVYAIKQAYLPNEVKDAEKRSRIAQIEFSKSTINERKAILQDISDWIINNQDYLIKQSCLETGKTSTEAALGEIFVVVEKIRWLIAHGDQYIKTEYRSVASLLSFTKSARVEYHPLGVIGLIVPLNYPINNVISHVVVALLTGNGVVCKVSEQASYTAEILEDMFRIMLAKRGYNPNLIQIITGYGETGASLVSSGIDKLLFIGSPAIGKLVAKGASQTLTPCILELGGKDPFIIFNDCEYKQMLETALLAAFINNGQNCVAAERYYVQADIYQQFINDISLRMNQLRQQNKVNYQQQQQQQHNVKYDTGAITMKQQIDLIDNLVQDAINKGAKVICGGKKFNHDQEATAGYYYPPTVLANVTHQMKIAINETFGPVMTIIKFKDEDDLINMINDTPYALGSSIFTTDYHKAERIGKMVKAGMLTINDFNSVPIIHSLPFGGIGQSGYGHFNGPEGIRNFCLIKSIVTDRIPFIRTKLPSFLQYPQHKYSTEIIKEAVKMVYGNSYIQSIRSLFNIFHYLLIKK